MSASKLCLWACVSPAGMLFSPRALQPLWCSGLFSSHCRCLGASSAFEALGRLRFITRGGRTPERVEDRKLNTIKSFQPRSMETQNPNIWRSRFSFDLKSRPYMKLGASQALTRLGSKWASMPQRWQWLRTEQIPS